jgi:hypothetical protein
MSSDDASSSPVDVAKETDSPTSSHTPSSESPPLPDEEATEGETAEPALNPDPQPEPDPAAIAAEADKFKEKGNNSFKRGLYGEAVDLYTKAIGASLLLPSSFSPFSPKPCSAQMC